MLQKYYESGSHVRILRDIVRMLRKLPGGYRILNKIRERYISKDISQFVNDYDGNLKLRLNLSEKMQSQIFWYGYSSIEICAVLKRILKPGMYVVDVGANIGEITLLSSNCVGSHGMVYSFEPVTEIVNTLRYNVYNNGISNVQIMAKGLYHSEGSFDIFQDDSIFHDGSIHSGLNTLFQTNNRKTICERIEVTTLDIFVRNENIKKVDLVKIDVEGSELAVLKGARLTLEKFSPYLIVEIQNEMALAAGYQASDILEFLEKLGYKFFSIRRRGKLRRINNPSELKDFQNVLCVHQKHVF